MSEPRLHRIAGCCLVTADPARLVGFYREVGFAPHGEERCIEGAEMRLLGLSSGRQSLTLGAKILSIDWFEAAGRPYPAEGDAASLSFQHLALVVDDIGQAHARLRDVAAISSDGQQHLPSSSGGVHAFKFRDPDGHPLELLQFPRRLISGQIEVVSMIPRDGTPHLELLGYRVSNGDRGPALMANDVAATRIVWRGGEARLRRDPDGHLQQVER